MFWERMRRLRGLRVWYISRRKKGRKGSEFRVESAWGIFPDRVEISRGERKSF